MTVPRPTIKDQNVGGGPVPGNLHPFPKIVEIILPLISLYNYWVHKTKSESRSVVSDSSRPHALYSPWNSPGQNTRVSSLCLLQGIFPTQGSNPDLPHCRWILYQLSQAIKHNHTTFWGCTHPLGQPTLLFVECISPKATLDFWDGPHSVCRVCFSLNKSTSYLSLCLSVNSFCNETSRTWASLGPKTRHVTSVERSWVLAVFKYQFGYWLSPAHGFKSQSEVNGFS